MAMISNEGRINEAPNEAPLFCLEICQIYDLQRAIASINLGFEVFRKRRKEKFRT